MSDAPKTIDPRTIGIPVALRDVLPWTKRNCRSCDGYGALTVLVKGERTKRLCHCGVRRFRKVQQCTVINGQLFAVDPWVAVHPETIAEAVEALEKQEAEKAAKLKAIADQTNRPENSDGPAPNNGRTENAPGDNNQPGDGASGDSALPASVG